MKASYLACLLAVIKYEDEVYVTRGEYETNLYRGKSAQGFISWLRMHYLKASFIKIEV